MLEPGRDVCGRVASRWMLLFPSSSLIFTPSSNSIRGIVDVCLWSLLLKLRVSYASWERLRDRTNEVTFLTFSMSLDYGLPLFCRLDLVKSYLIITALALDGWVASFDGGTLLVSRSCPDSSSNTIGLLLVCSVLNLSYKCLFHLCF